MYSILYDTNVDIQPRGNYNYKLFATGGRDDTISGEVVFHREDCGFV